MATQRQEARGASSDKRRRFVVLLLARLAIFTALLGSSLVFPLQQQGQLSFSGKLILVLVGMVYIGSAASFIMLRLGRPGIDLQLQFQIVFDVLAAAVLVYLTGGVESPFSFFFALPVIVAAVFLARRGVFLVAGLSCLLLGAELVLESRGILPSDLVGRVGSPPGLERVAYLLALNFAMLLAVAWLAGTLGEQLRRTGRTLEVTRNDLARLEALHRDIVQSLLSGLLVLDEDSRVTLVNPVAEAILGSPWAELEGRRLDEVLPELARHTSPDASREITQVELEHRRPAGSIPIGVTISPLRTDQGRRAGTLIHMQDLSERRQMEESVHRAERMAALGQMAAGLAHEIRNPLASISGSVQMLGSAASASEQDRRLKEIVVRETRRLDELLRQFLSFARPRSPQRQRIQLAELVREVIEVFSASLVEGEVGIDSERQPIEVDADADQLRQVLLNLLGNAADSAGSGGRVRITLERREDGRQVQAVLQVEDTGPPMAKEVREHLFEPFFTTKPEGTGLGLAIASRIVQAHGGRIEVVTLDDGNRFVVVLPGARDE